MRLAGPLCRYVLLRVLQTFRTLPLPWFDIRRPFPIRMYRTVSSRRPSERPDHIQSRITPGAGMDAALRMNTPTALRLSQGWIPSEPPQEYRAAAHPGPRRYFLGSRERENGGIGDATSQRLPATATCDSHSHKAAHVFHAQSRSHLLWVDGSGRTCPPTGSGAGGKCSPPALTIHRSQGEKGGLESEDRRVSPREGWSGVQRPSPARRVSPLGWDLGDRVVTKPE